MDRTQQPGKRLDREVLSVAIELADEALAGRRVARASYAELIAQLYEALLGGWPVGGLVPYARAIADEMVQQDRRPLERGVRCLKIVV